MSAPIKIGGRRTSADIAVQVVGRFLNLVLGVGVTLVIVRTLGAHSFGVWSTLLAITQIAANLGEMGLNQVAVSRAAAAPERESSWLGALVLVRVLIAVPIVLASVLAVLLIAPNAHARVAGTLLSCTILVSSPAALGAVFQLRVRNDITTGLLTFNSVVWAGAVIAVAASGGDLVPFAVAMLGVSVLTSTLTVVVALRFTTVSLEKARELLRELVRVGLTVGAAGIFVTFYVRLDQILVLEFGGAVQAGLYGAAYRILDQVQFVPASVITTLFPLIAAAYPRERGRVRELVQTAAEVLAMVSLPVLAFTIVGARQIMTLLFTAKFAPAAPALPILMAAFVVISFGYLTGNLVVVLRLQRRFLLYAAVGLLVNATLNVMLIPPYGFKAAAWVTLVTEIVVLALLVRDITSGLAMRVRVGRMARTALAAALMGAITWIARDAGVGLAGMMIIGALAYLLAIFALGVITPSEVRLILRDRAAGSTSG